MFPVHNYKDLYMAYLLLKITTGRGGLGDHVKAEIRRFQNQPPTDRKCIHEDDAPSYIMKIEAPAWCKTKADVEEWFEREEYLVCQPSQYDCTGQHFTVWYKPALLHGKWYAYHYVGVDV